MAPMADAAPGLRVDVKRGPTGCLRAQLAAGHRDRRGLRRVLPWGYQRAAEWLSCPSGRSVGAGLA